MKRFVAAWLALALGAGCAIGPSYRRPELPTPPAFRDASADAASIADLPWFEVFRDDVLDALVREALGANRDLLLAAARVEQARDLAAVARSELFPRVGGEFDAARGKGTTLGAINGSQRTADSFLAALNFVWEIDLWGRIRRSTESARAQMLATEAGRRGVVLSLVTAVARAYFELRELDRELEIAHDSVRSFEETYELFERQFLGGVTSRLDSLRAEAALAQAAAEVPAIEQAIVAKENELSLLLGRPAGPIARGVALEAQSTPPEIPAGVPAQLLERRPDLVEAEQTLVAANAQIGAALAEFFPRIGLTGLWGSVSPELSTLLESGTGIWSLAGQAAGPLLTFGQTWYAWESTQAGADAARFAYEGAVLNALGEVSDALTARDKLAVVRVQQERAVAALRESVRISKVRYVGGLSDYLEVLDALQQLYPAEFALAQTQRDELLAVVALYRALGGGWNQYPAPPAIPLPLAP
ncbi:MAG: RND transporter [Proteobacteria bacterium]|nr:MAG: RND transporter [Pseudomonadota bacterium]